MKLTLANIKELKRNSGSPLTKRVCNYVIGRWGDYNDKKYIFTDVLHNGCCSGVVSELIYYYDTVRFYKQYRQEINEMLYNIMKTRKIRLRRMTSIRTCWRGSASKRRSETSATTLKH